MFEQLCLSGGLDAALTDRAEQVESSYEAAVSAVNERALLASRGLSHQEAVSEMMRGRNEAARIALDQAVEFDELEVTSKPRFSIFEVEGRAVIEGCVPERGIWAAVWEGGAWRSAPGLVGKEGLKLSHLQLLDGYPDADLEAARAFARNIPDFAFFCPGD
jgi:hypothetical protein